MSKPCTNYAIENKRNIAAGVMPDEMEHSRKKPKGQKIGCILQEMHIDMRMKGLTPRKAFMTVMI